VDDEILDVLHVRGGLGDPAAHPPFREEARPETRRREEEEEAPDETQVGEQRVDGTEAPFSNAAFNDAPHDIGNAKRIGDDFPIETPPAGQHLPKHHDREVGVSRCGRISDQADEVAEEIAGNYRRLVDVYAAAAG